MILIVAFARDTLQEIAQSILLIVIAALTRFHTIPLKGKARVTVIFSIETQA